MKISCSDRIGVRHCFRLMSFLRLPFIYLRRTMQLASENIFLGDVRMTLIVGYRCYLCMLEECRYLLPADLEAAKCRGIKSSEGVRIMCRCEFAPSRGKIRRTKVVRIFTNSGGRNKSDNKSLTKASGAGLRIWHRRCFIVRRTRRDVKEGILKSAHDFFF